MARRTAGTFTAVFEKHGKWFVGYVEEIPGVNTQGRTLSSARKNLREALRMVLRANRELSSAGRRRGAVRERVTVAI